MLVFYFILLAFSPQKDPDKYAGTEACLVCHEDLGNAFLKSSRHAVVEKDAKRGWKEHSCESCHGPGLAHGEAAEAKHIVRQPAAECLSCHKRHTGMHSREEVACSSCHSIHTPRQVSTNQLCSNCHIAEKAAFQRPHTHAVNQGAMTCLDCHNPHNQRRARSGEAFCFNCHADKRGPFAFEHAPVRLEGCGSCHEPHGSANPRMLRRAEVLNLCLECHSNTQPGRTLGGVASGSHDLRLPVYRNCTSCHTKVHGSHVNRNLLR